MNIDEIEKAEILALSKGDIRGFNALYERYCKLIHQNVQKFIDDRELAIEVLQDVFLSLWQSRFKIRADHSVAGWLFAVSYHKSLNILRRKLKTDIAYLSSYPENLLYIEEESSEEEELFQRQMKMLDEAIAILPKRKREVYRMHRYEGRTKEDVACMMGISIQSVIDYLKQSNKAIRAYVARKYS